MDPSLGRAEDHIKHYMSEKKILQTQFLKLQAGLPISTIDDFREKVEQRKKVRKHMNEELL